MTDDKSGVQPAENKDGSGGQEIVPPVQGPEPEPVEFVDRVIAFLLIIGPFSYVVAWLQSEFADMVSLSVHNMIMLVAIIGFLLLVGKASKRVHRVRKRYLK